MDRPLLLTTLMVGMLVGMGSPTSTGEHVVVGAGIHGLCTAFWLVQAGVTRLTVFERHGPCHPHGSSHGTTRITRATYEQPEFVRLARRAAAEGWPALERELGRPLRVPTPGVFFGPANGPIAAYAAATRAAGAAVAPLHVTAARARFPLLAFADDDLVLEDHEAAVLCAEDAMRGLSEWLTQRGVALRWREPVVGLTQDDDGVAIATAGGAHRAASVVVATGAWLPQLVAAPTTQTVLRQHVAYGLLATSPAAMAPGAFPVWCRIGRGANAFCYGLPAHDARGVKFAHHRTNGVADDADEVPRDDDPAPLAALAAELFTTPLQLTHREHCLYTMTADQRIAVAAIPGSPRIVAITACSGHGFKFGPLVGERAAALALAAAHR